MQMRVRLFPVQLPNVLPSRFLFAWAMGSDQRMGFIVNKPLAHRLQPLLALGRRHLPVAHDAVDRRHQHDRG